MVKSLGVDFADCSIGKWDAVTLPVKPDHIDEERDARAHIVSHDQSEEEGAGTAIGSAAAKAQDREFAQPAEENWEDYMGYGIRRPGCQSQWVQRPPGVAVTQKVQEGCEDDAAGKEGHFAPVGIDGISCVFDHKVPFWGRRDNTVRQSWQSVGLRNTLAGLRRSGPLKS